jgi:hypothetical protein
VSSLLGDASMHMCLCPVHHDESHVEEMVCVLETRLLHGASLDRHIDRTPRVTCALPTHSESHRPRHDTHPTCKCHRRPTRHVPISENVQAAYLLSKVTVSYEPHAGTASGVRVLPRQMQRVRARPFLAKVRCSSQHTAIARSS